ncbi:MAG: hypothetical protein Fur0044_40370 [Anaerolineae bacterium]|nr:hypothetical protein [Anaerolineales bacterium]MCQ3974279.1 hypothetical protein [Anaerolineae bacterium]
MESLQAKLDQLAQAYCPVVNQLGLQYHWSLLQAEYATDLIFKTPQTLQTFFPLLLAALIQAVQPADIATFLLPVSVTKTFLENYNNSLSCFTRQRPGAAPAGR